MTRLITDPTTFAADAITGFVAANPAHVRQVDGGVVRATVTPAGQVAVVIGGGSGHYPSFAGLVGPGLAAGAVCGNIFASPSSGQVCRVARTVERGAGVLLSYGNYAGDVLQFGLAAERLRGEGIDVRTVAVTDDIASAPPAEAEKRRGIAGDLVVFKIAGAAAQAGYDLDGVERVARLANARTRSLGVAFSGCTLPGATEPLFSVADGMMAIGLGIHGEPGLSESPVTTATELAALLVGKLLDDLPAGQSKRAVVILNGLGGFKYDELFVLFGEVATQLAEAEVTIVGSECGELVTSLDMAGVSLSLFWVDDELAALWDAPTSTPSFRKGAIALEHDEAAIETVTEAAHPIDPATPENHAAAVLTLDALTAVHRMILDSEDEFGRIDAIAGDGDHGIGMSRGSTGALHAADRVVSGGGGVVQLLAEAGEAWSEHGGGTSGALWGIALTAAGTSLAAADQIDSAAAVRAAAAAALQAVQHLGHARLGDKTMVDAFIPFVEQFERSGQAGLGAIEAWTVAAEHAVAAAEATSSLRPLLGRARPHVEASLGHPDAGAVSFGRIVTTVGEQVADSHLVSSRPTE